MGPLRIVVDFVICTIRGHDWRTHVAVPGVVYVYCWRCGTTRAGRARFTDTH